MRLKNDRYLIVIVRLKISSHPLYDPYDSLTAFNLEETPNGMQCGRWIVVTGMTKPWDFQNESISPLNWIKINNPFGNRVEYYPWREFNLSVNSNSMVEVSVKKNHKNSSIFRCGRIVRKSSEI